ncbi:MAG TPA: hypothetical protein DEB05_01325 [Firmicutes bacterium]|jgi:spore germination protein KB|nr:hypothetical protein [Bacillota bacterium]
MEEGRISSSQLSLLAISYLIGTTFLLSPGSQAKQGTWLTILLGLGEALIPVLIFTTLAKRFAGKSLIEINDLVWGKIVGKLFSLVFLWYIFHLGSASFAIFVALFKTTVLIATPEVILLISGLLSCIYVSKKGIEVIARTNEVLILITVLLLILGFLLVLNIFNANNLFPVIEIPITRLLWATQESSSLFGQTIVFMMIFPYLNRRKSCTGAIIKGLVVAAILLMSSAVRTTGVLGKISESYIFPNYETDRLIDIGNTLTRLEILPVLNFLTMGFIKSSVSLYVTSLGTAQLLNLRTYRPVVIPLGILMIIAATQNYPDISSHLRFVENIHPIYALPVQIIFPLITLLLAIIRRLPCQGENQ